MAAAALTGLLLVVDHRAGTERLARHRQRRRARRGAARGGVGTGLGRGGRASAGFLFRRWRQSRRGGKASAAALGRRALCPWTKPAGERSEPQATRATVTPIRLVLPEAKPEPAGGRLVRFVLPGTRSLGGGKRAEQERQSTLDLAPNGQPILPPIELLAKAPAAKAETIDEEALAKNARLLEAVLEDYGVRGEIGQVRPGAGRHLSTSLHSRRPVEQGLARYRPGRRHRPLDERHLEKGRASCRGAASSASNCPTPAPRPCSCASCSICPLMKSTPAGWLGLGGYRRRGGGRRPGAHAVFLLIAGTTGPGKSVWTAR